MTEPGGIPTERKYSRRKRPAIDRWRDNIDASGDCWVWLAFKNAQGYGLISDDERNTRFVHRFAYEAMRGPIPDGLQLDHLCRNPSCCNPDHLEPVTPAENTRRGNAGLHMRQKSASITHCPRGHEYTPENSYYWQTRRSCRACARARQAQKRRAA